MLQSMGLPEWDTTELDCSSSSALTAARQASLFITNSRSLLKLMSIKSVMPSNHLILCRPLLSPPIPPSIRVFSNESTLRMKWPKYWSFSFSIIPSKEHPGLISFRMDWLGTCSPRDSQESSPTPQFKSINSLALSFLYSPTLKAMAPQSSTLAWKIPWTEEPGRLQSMGLQRVRHGERLHFHFSLSCTGEGNGNPLQCSCLESPRGWGAWWAAIYGVTQSRT